MPSGWVGSGRRARLPSNWPAIRAAVLRRDGHQCTWVQDEQRCTQPAIEVDHSPQHHKPIHITVDVGPDITPSLLRSTHRIPSPTITIDTTKLGTSCQVAGAAPHHNQTATHGNGNKPGIAPSSHGGYACPVVGSAAHEPLGYHKTGPNAPPTYGRETATPAGSATNRAPTRLTTRTRVTTTALRTSHPSTTEHHPTAIAANHPAKATQRDGSTGKPAPKRNIPAY
jgi:hypothetical protein